MTKTVEKSETQNNQRWTILLGIAGAFITYFSMYAFRKPFSAAEFADLSLWGIDYKIILIITQVIGYTISKFLGIKVVSELKPHQRITMIVSLIGVAWGALLLFGLVPQPYNFIFLFFNGLPLGMIWGMVFAFLEGRRQTELLAAGMASSFIVASGFVKSVGRSFVLSGVSEFWMPFLTGLCFVPTLFLGLWLLSKMAPPNEEDEDHRTERVPMTRADRGAFFKKFSVGIVSLTVIYMLLNAYRDFRDNFAVEIWNGLGFADVPEMLTFAEIPIAVLVLIISGVMILIRNNRSAFYVNFAMFLFGGLSVIVTTYLFNQNIIGPAFWMISVGFGMYLAYMFYHTMLFERWIALFKTKSNIGYLMYICDAFGYLASVGVMLYKDFFVADLSWLEFFKSLSMWMGIVTVILTIFTVFVFRWYEHRYETDYGAAPSLAKRGA